MYDLDYQTVVRRGGDQDVQPFSIEANQWPNGVTAFRPLDHLDAMTALLDQQGGGASREHSQLTGENITQHPAAKTSAPVLMQLMKRDALNLNPPAKVVSEAVRRELLDKGGLGHQTLVKAETQHDSPAVQEAGPVITSDTRLVIVDPQLRSALAARSEGRFSSSALGQCAALGDACRSTRLTACHRS